MFARAGSVAVVVAIAVVAAGGAPRPAQAGRDHGNSLVAIGLGPSSEVTGALAERVRGGGPTVRLRLGGRFGALGCDLVINQAMLDHDASDQSGLWLITPTLAYYPIHNPWLQLGARAGLGFGALGHTVPGDSSWCDGPECEGDGSDGDHVIRHSALGLDLGVTGQVQLGRRRGGRAVLWIDAGVALTRVAFDDAVVSGRVFQITMGIGHGITL